MSKYTAGPWEYSKPWQTIYGKSLGGCNKTFDTFMIANIRGWGHLQYLPNGEEIQDANGRLIAAAPDLLEALELLIDASNFSHSCQDGLVDRCICQDCANKKARAAIKKAIGYE